MGGEVVSVRRVRILPECMEYASFLSKEMGLSDEEKMKVAEVCSNSGIRRWRGAIAYAAAYILKYGGRASGAAARARNDLAYLWTFAPTSMTFNSFKTHVAKCVVELQERYPELRRPSRAEDEYSTACASLGVPSDVCEEAMTVYRRLADTTSMHGKSRRGLAAGALLYASEKRGLKLKIVDVARAFRVSPATVRTRLKDISEALDGVEHEGVSEH